ncbi:MULTISPECIES: PTS mannose/fructose/sorbose/N-acetylgalactosamine transporter subunit IIC [Clostridium]|uniref:PTS sorbose transporter subunit IIC n=2 Tax=Clostridium TaxID=1485 RepID=A0A1S8SQW5_CLOBE|nr:MULTISPECIES: PTS sugar transporter subunit IIC [Clostridium]MBN7574882.1 PTS sugar transporter subunit IIC [Clostridium beijerinckii]MBN7579774.1 PTS sugar transporter subunit IIC [Clostridium beijerinckii]MBN7584646.1 PTS sugar transporter subunit IIC [Clostridium beijerinckii]MBO0520465.1 PTS sugar transporter subunit IIC [Clostridium beijerinckii]MZK53371.1 PTS sugar transporter subunit IIC [Clostridium beijerinckii]
METLSVLQSFLIALWVGAVMSRWFGGGASLTLRFSPLMTGLIVGIVMGNVGQAMIVTAALQLIYMGVFSPGGSMPQEPSIAAAIAVPVALLGNLQPEAAIAVAVPVGLLGSYLYQFRFFINTFLGKYTDKAVEDLNDGAIKRSIILLPTIASFALFVPLVFVALYFGAPIIADVINALKGSYIIHILEVVGGGLAAIGIATTVYVIGRKDYLAFFFLAYFMSVSLKSLNITMVTYAVFGLLIALIFSMSQKGKNVPSTNVAKGTETLDEDDYDDGF